MAESGRGGGGGGEDEVESEGEYEYVTLTSAEVLEKLEEVYYSTLHDIFSMCRLLLGLLCVCVCVSA